MAFKYGYYGDDDDDEKQLKIVYLFLSSENKISNSDFALFEKLGKSIEGFSKMRKEIINECEKILEPSDNGKSRFEIVSDTFSYYKTTGGTAVSHNRAILWKLVCLLYQNEEKSDKKQELVELWAEVNEIDKSIVLEMYDTSEAVYSLSKCKKWLETGNGIPFQEDNSIMQEFDKDMENLQQSVSDLIALG